MRRNEKYAKIHAATISFLTEGVLEMKKLLKLTVLVGGAAGALAYINKNGLPVLGNLTMHLPFRFRYDGLDAFTKGIEIAEGLTKK